MYMDLQRQKHIRPQYMALNINGLIRNKDIFEKWLFTVKPDVICLTETHIGPDILLNSTEISDKTWINVVQIGGSDGFVIVNVYRSPKNRVSEFKENMVELLENYVDKGKLITVGDFNLDVGSDKDRYARNFVNECALLGLKQLVKVPTRSTLTSDTIIDLVFSNVELYIDVLSTPRVSDHNIIVINSDLNIEQSKNLGVIEKRNFNKFDPNIFCDIFADRYKIDINDDIDVVINKFNSSITYALDVVAPKTEKIVKPKYYDKKWITKELIEKMKERDRLFFVSKKFGIEEDINNYKRLRNDIVDELRTCKREHNDNNIDANKNNGKILWRELKELIGMISNKFNHYFIDSIEKIVYEIGFNQLKDVVSDNSNNQKWDSFHRVTHTAEKCLIYRGFIWYNYLPETTKNETRLKIFKTELRNFVKENY
ncbi:Protein of unknown function [Cotesia congregata]|uniref:Endonuclease/exonuclease/phosphatase domain-containing protein n=1 Tax=Cotesia congregata TaxID=51543 RepID=A0A8J2HEA7_COTCN|nr:Protein of unknown function [Cotesia congregata]